MALPLHERPPILKQRFHMHQNMKLWFHHCAGPDHFGAGKRNGGTDPTWPFNPRWKRKIHQCYGELSSADKKLADVLLMRQKDLLSYSATELAELASVSKASAARFFRRSRLCGLQRLPAIAAGPGLRAISAVPDGTQRVAA
ncbi:hypothetical protein ACU4GD_18050 [Cupriavidus basilensis]